MAIGAATNVCAPPQAVNVPETDPAFGTEARTLRDMLGLLRGHDSGQGTRLMVVTGQQMLEDMRVHGMRLSHAFPCAEYEGSFYAVYD